MSKVRGLFDEQFRLEKLSKKNDPLENLPDILILNFSEKRYQYFAMLMLTLPKVAGLVMMRF